MDPSSQQGQAINLSLSGKRKLLKLSPPMASSSSFLIKNILSLSESNFRSLDLAKQSNLQSTQFNVVKSPNHIVDLRIRKFHQQQPQLKVLHTTGSLDIEFKQTHEEQSSQLQQEANHKRIRNRTMFSEWQLESLEMRFNRNKYLTTTDRLKVAKMLKLNQLQVKTWFQVSMHSSS